MSPERWDRGRPRPEDEVDEEIGLHLERRAQEFMEAGLSPDEAYAEARRRFGNIDQTRRACVESTKRWRTRTRWQQILGDLGADLRGALRSLRRSPGSAWAAAGTLALGIAAATVVYSAADHVLFRPLDFNAPDRVVTLWQHDTESGEETIPVLPGDFHAWEEAAEGSIFVEMGLAEPFSKDMVWEDRTLAMGSWMVTPGWFEALGLLPVQGRVFEADDAVQGAEPVVVVSYEFWQRYLGGDADALGSSILLDGAATRVVGILGDQPHWPYHRDLYHPRAPRPGDEQNFGRGYMHAVGRLAAGVTPEQARQALAISAREIGSRRGASEQLTVGVVELREEMLGDLNRGMYLLLGAAGILLLIAVANVAGLLLAQGVGRQRELALRAALGAQQGRIARQLLVEHGVLVLLAGGVGIFLAWGALQSLVPLLPADLPRGSDLGIDGRVLGGSLVITGLSALLVGLVPVLLSRGTDRAHGAGTARLGTDGPGPLRLRRTLVIFEVAATVVVLVGGGLLGRSLYALLTTDLGFHAEGVASAQVHLWDRNPSPTERLVRGDQILRAIEAAPGVEAAGIVTSLPFFPSRIDRTTTVGTEGRLPDERDAPTMYITVADSGYFATLGIPVLTGRGFTSADDGAGPRAVLLNETASRLLFPGQDAVGRAVTTGTATRATEWQVVGVVGDTRATSFDAPAQPELYVPFAQSGNGSLTFVARGSDGPALLAALQEAIWDVDPIQSVYEAGLLSDYMDESTAGRRFELILLSAFGGLALILSAVGLFALLSFSARRRTREMGIRVSLGAERKEIAWLILRDGLGMTSAGTVLGVVLAAAGSRLLASSLYGVAPLDLWTYGGIAALTLAVALASSSFPALRASRRDPVTALRTE